jgi:hypothetical protein
MMRAETILAVDIKFNIINDTQIRKEQVWLTKNQFEALHNLRQSLYGSQFFISSNFFLVFSSSCTGSQSNSAAFTKQPFHDKIVFTSCGCIGYILFIIENQ